MDGTTLEERLTRLLTPRGFFLGLILGFGACCLAGRQAPKLAPFENIERLHSHLNPDTFYQPTALQIRAWARQQLPRDKIAVVIGGNSTFFGLGQAPYDVWTRHLQEKLGDEFRVLNLAVCGGPPNGFGLAAAEMLARDHPRLLYVCNCVQGKFTKGPDGGHKAYRYLYHDARSRGLLLPFAQRDAALAQAEAAKGNKAADSELHLKTSSNRWLSFNDLWNVVGYEFLFTMWTKETPWEARRRSADDVLLREGPRAQHPDVKTVMRQLARPITPAAWVEYDAQIRQSIPPPLRARTLAVVVHLNPADMAVVEAETPGFAADYAVKTETVLAHLRSSGLHAVEACADLDENGFVDYLHLNARGGAKMAAELAPVIRDLARQQSFLGNRNGEYAQQ